eukprot:g34075.t1
MELVEDDLREGSVEFLSQVAIEKEELLCILESIKVDKSPGPDETYPRILREAREQIAGSPLGEVPEVWRMANVVPLFKKGSRDNPGNNRPVSLTSVVGKLLEKVRSDEICKHLEANGLISDRQHGFVWRSCLTNLIEFFEVMKMIDEGKAVDIVYTDFSKASDKVRHGRLVQKGSVLGPLLFVTYTNSLEENVAGLI